MFNIFNSKNKLDNKSNRVLNNLSESINNQTKNKEDLEDFIFILEQIQEINNTKEQGKGSIMKNYAQRKLSIDNAINLAIEKTKQKIVELDNITI